MRRNDYDHREPFLVDENGLYVTVSQMGFYMNRPRKKLEFNAKDTEFLNYYKNCCLYNLVYDMMEEDSTCAKMYWDSDHECVSLTFPVNGEVAKALAVVGRVFEANNFNDDDYDDDDEDIYGIFS